MKLCPLEGHSLMRELGEERRDRHVINKREQIKDEEVPSPCTGAESKTETSI